MLVVKNRVVCSTPSIISNRRSVFTNFSRMSFVGYQSLIRYSISWHPMIIGGWIYQILISITFVNSLEKIQKKATLLRLPIWLQFLALHMTSKNFFACSNASRQKVTRHHSRSWWTCTSEYNMYFQNSSF